MGNGAFAAIPTAMIRDESVSIYAITVYAALATYGGYEIVAPSRETLARNARCSVRKVADALNELEALGVLEREHRTGPRGQATTCYVLITGRRQSVKAHGAPSAEVEAPDARGGGTSEQTTPYIEIDKEEIDISANAQPQSAHSFEDWWKIYPLKKDKGRARTAWKSALKKTTVDVLMAAAAAYRDDVNRDPRFTKYPASWLNAEAWENGPLHQRSASSSGGTAVERMVSRARALSQQDEERRELGA